MQPKPELRPTALRTIILRLAVAGAMLGIGSRAMATDLTGCWEGCWGSGTNGHTGKLRARIAKIDDEHYCAHFSGTFWELIPFSYNATLTVKQQGDSLKLEACKNLPLLGAFSFEGSATDTDFNANYTSRRDCGEFKMQRMPPCGCCGR